MRNRKTERQKYLDATEYAALLGAITDSAHYLLFYLLGNLGLRVGEGVRLRAEDVDHTHYAVRVPTLKADRRAGRSGCIRRGELPKTYIDLPIDATTSGFLRAYVRRRRIHGWLFPWPDGLHIPEWRAKKLFKVYAAKAGLDPIYSIHALRHYRGTALYGQLKDVRAVQSLLRHRSISSTEVYAHVDLDLKRELAARVLPVTGLPEEKT